MKKAVLKPLALMTVADLASPLSEEDQEKMVAELCSSLGLDHWAIENYSINEHVNGAFPTEFVMRIGESKDTDDSADDNWLYGIPPGIESEHYPEDDNDKWRFTVWFTKAPYEINGVMMAFDHYDVEGMRQMVAWIRKVIQKEMTGEQFWDATEQYRK